MKIVIIPKKIGSHLSKWLASWQGYALIVSLNIVRCLAQANQPLQQARLCGRARGMPEGIAATV